MQSSSRKLKAIKVILLVLAGALVGFAAGLAVGVKSQLESPLEEFNKMSLSELADSYDNTPGVVGPWEMSLAGSFAWYSKDEFAREVAALVYRLEGKKRDSLLNCLVYHLESYMGKYERPRFREMVDWVKVGNWQDVSANEAAGLEVWRAALEAKAKLEKEKSE